MADKYHKIADKIELDLRRMRALGETRLPSEQDLAKTFSCSRETIRSALDVLTAKGLIVKRKGSGSFIADKAFSSNKIFFITEDCDKYISPDLIERLKKDLAKSRYELMPFSTEGKRAEEKKILLRALEEKPAALITEPVQDIIPNPNNKILEGIISSGIPVIFFNSSKAPKGAVSITCDNREGVTYLIHKLKDQGRKNIGCIFRMDHSTGLERYQGYIDALEDQDLTYDESHCLLLSHKDKKNVIIGNDRIIDNFASNITSECDAIICQNDMVAYHLIEVLKKKGIKVPEEIAVVSFDNSYYAHNGVGFLSVGTEESSISKALANTVTAAIEGRKVNNVTVPWSI